MMNLQIAPRPGAGLFLLPAPSVYDFRERDDMLTGTASGAARVPDQAACVPSRPRRAIPYW
jgi:hypothetical protein